MIKFQKFFHRGVYRHRRQSYFHRYVINITKKFYRRIYRKYHIAELFGNLNGRCIKCLSHEVLRIHPFPCMNRLGREASLRFYAIMSLPNQGSGKRLEYTHWLIDSTKSGEYSYISGVMYRIRRLPLLISGRTSSFFELPPTYAALIPDCLHYSLTYYL